MALALVVIMWRICIIAQELLAYGTAYRLTKRGGDNGVAYFGWFFLMSLAAVVPGLGVYLWYRYKDEE